MTTTRSGQSRIRLAILAILSLAMVLSALLMTAPVLSQASSKIVGIAAALVRDVRIRPASTTSFAPAKLRQRLAIADRVQTGANSRMQIALLDRTKISVGPNALLTIDKFIFDPKGGSVSVSAAKGALRFMSGSSKSSRTLRTPSATIGIRGTVFDTAIGALAVEIAQREKAVPKDTRHDPNTATLAVLRGPGPNRQGYESIGAIDVEGGGKSVALEQPLLAAYVPYAGAQPIGPFTISLPGLASLSNFILPPPNRPDFDPTAGDHPYLKRERKRPAPWMYGYPDQPGAEPPPGYEPDGNLEDFFPSDPQFPQRQPQTPAPNPPTTGPSPNQPPTSPVGGPNTIP